MKVSQSWKQKAISTTAQNYSWQGTSTIIHLQRQQNPWENIELLVFSHWQKITTTTALWNGKDLCWVLLYLQLQNNLIIQISMRKESPPTMYMRMSLIITMAVWWSFQAWFSVCRKLLFKEFRTSSRTWNYKQILGAHQVISGLTDKHQVIRTNVKLFYERGVYSSFRQCSINEVHSQSHSRVTFTPLLTCVDF